MDSQEKEIEEAALILCSMKHAKVDEETALEIEKARHFALKKLQFQKPSSPPSLNHHRKHLVSLVPPSVAEVIGKCSAPIEKRLTGSDTQENQVRLLLKHKDVIQFLHPLLRPSEVDRIKKRGMYIDVYDCHGKMYQMVFRLWGLKAYVITTRNWYEFCIDHGLEQVLDWVTIWMFRHNVTGRICFVINSERRIVSRAVRPVFDFPVSARKKRTKSCSSSDSKRRRLNYDDE